MIRKSWMVLHGNTVKLREHPKALSTKQLWKHNCGQGNDLGYSKNDKDNTMGNPQPSPKLVEKLAWMQFTD
jgi:hypothetical protein